MKKASLLLLLLTAAGAYAAKAGDDSAATVRPTPYMHYVELADSLVRAEAWDEAETALRLALRTEPANPSNQLLLSNMGMILTAQGKYGEAIEHLDVALTLNPRSFLALKHRGLARSAMGCPEEAISDFSEALAIDSADNGVRCLRAAMYAHTRRYPSAIADFSRVLDSDRENPEALEGMANCCIAKGAPEEAVPFLNRLLDIRKEPEHYFTRGLVLARLGRLPEASEDVSQGLLIEPANGDLWLLKAYVEKLTYRINEAKESLAKARRYGADPNLENELLPDF